VGRPLCRVAARFVGIPDGPAMCDALLESDVAAELMELADPLRVFGTGNEGNGPLGGLSEGLGGRICVVDMSSMCPSSVPVSRNALLQGTSFRPSASSPTDPHICPSATRSCCCDRKPKLAPQLMRERRGNDEKTRVGGFLSLVPVKFRVTFRVVPGPKLKSRILSKHYRATRFTTRFLLRRSHAQETGSLREIGWLVV
jgi:hypothetical protein